jgi:hypothetical protein
MPSSRLSLVILVLLLCFSTAFSQQKGKAKAPVRAPAKAAVKAPAKAPAKVVPSSSSVASSSSVEEAAQEQPAVSESASIAETLPEPEQPEPAPEPEPFASEPEPAPEAPSAVASGGGTVAPFGPKGEFEKQEDYEARRAKWEKEAINKLTARDTTAKGYINRIAYSRELGLDSTSLQALILVLEDRRITEESKLVTEAAPNAKFELSAYDAEKETFDMKIQDTENAKNPFVFQGSVFIPIGTAKSMDRNNTSEFAASVVFLNYPFEQDESTRVNLAMQKLLLTKSGKNLSIKGSFSEVEQYTGMYGYNAYKQHADSILDGTLKPRNLSYKDALRIANGGTVDEPLMGWRGWTRLATFSLAIVGGVAAAFKHTDARKNKDNLDALLKKARDEKIYEWEGDFWTNESGDRVLSPKGIWKQDYWEQQDALADNEMYRNIFGVAAGVFATAGIVTFFF